MEYSTHTNTNYGSYNNTTPPLIVLFYVLAGLSLLGGVILCAKLWPGDPGYGSEWKIIAYTPSFTWLTVGIVEFAFFTAIGQALTYLKQIATNTRESKSYATSNSKNFSDDSVLLSEVSNNSLYVDEKSYDPKTKNYFGKIVEIDVQQNKCIVKKDVGGNIEKGLNEIMVYKII